VISDSPPPRICTSSELRWLAGLALANDFVWGRTGTILPVTASGHRRCAPGPVHYFRTRSAMRLNCSHQPRIPLSSRGHPVYFRDHRLASFRTCACIAAVLCTASCAFHRLPAFVAAGRGDRMTALVDASRPVCAPWRLSWSPDCCSIFMVRVSTRAHIAQHARIGR